jgi:hypothetical protein
MADSHCAQTISWRSFKLWAAYVERRQEKHSRLNAGRQHHVYALKSKGITMLKYFILRRRETHSRHLISDYFYEDKLKRWAVKCLLDCHCDKNETRAKLKVADIHYSNNLARLALSRFTYYLSPSFTHFKSMNSTAVKHHTSLVLSKIFLEWVDHSRCCKRARELETMAMDFFTEGTKRYIFTEWTQFVSVSRRESETRQMAIEFAAGGLAKWAFKMWLQSTAFSQRSRALHQRAAVFFVLGVLKRHFAIWVVSSAILKQERSADQYRKFILVRQAFDAMCDFVEAKAEKVYLLRQADNHFVTTSELRVLQKLQENTSKSLRSKRLVFKGHLHYSARLAKGAFQSLSNNVTERQNSRWLNEDADSFFVQKAQRKFLDHLASTFGAQKQSRLLLLLADRHRNRFLSRKALELLKTESTNRKRMRRNKTVSNFFRVNRLSSIFFKAWNTYYQECKRRESLLQRLYVAFQFNTLEGIFHRYDGERQSALR